MIRKIVIEGVRTHEHTEIQLGRLTCLVGPNGSGKSTVLAALFLFKDGGSPASWVRASARSWFVEVEDATGAKATIGRHPDKINSDLGLNAIRFRPDSEVLRASSEFRDARPELGEDGSQLAAVLAAWKLSDEERFLEVLRQLIQVVPALEKLRPNTTKVGDKAGFELLFDFISASGVPARAVSEGTLLALGLITALHEVGGESPIVLLDDIDRGLHPDLQIELIKLLRQLAELKDLQIVMTTHSPYIVDALAPEEVCVLALDRTGTTHARPLSEFPGAEHFRGMLSTGELWSAMETGKEGRTVTSSTAIGHLNPRQQRVIRRVGLSPTLRDQYTYELVCERVNDDGVCCGHRYGANGPDIDGAGAGAGRRCPLCDGGRPGDPI